MKNRTKEIIVLSVLAIVLSVIAFFLLQGDKAIIAEVTAQQSIETESADTPLKSTATSNPTAALMAAPSAAPTPSPTPEAPKTVTLLFAGDVMAHERQIERHKFGSSYDFTIDYKYINDIISKADIALCNVEAPLKGKSPYTGSPRFNMPDSIADALSYAGFDVIANANNHTRDQMDNVIGRTAGVFNSKGLTVVGTATGKDGDTKYDIFEKNGIKIGFVNFTNSLNRGIGKETNKYVNVLRRDWKYDVGYKMMKEQIDALRASGAEFIVVYMHWGNENQLKGNSTQKAMARKIADLGADLIVGSHPHVPQNVAEYKSKVTGKTVLIYYSLGNLVTNQTYGFGLGHGYSETGLLALVKLKRGEDGKIAVDAAGYMTTYVHRPNVKVRYTENGKPHTRTVKAYYIVPARLVTANPSAYEGAKGSLLNHIKAGIANGYDIVGKPAEKLVYYSFFKEYTEWPWK